MECVLAHKQNLEVIAIRDSKKGQDNGHVYADEGRANDNADAQIADRNRFADAKVLSILD